MKNLVSRPQKNAALARAVALVLLVATLTIPQLAWADHSADIRMMDSAFLATNPELSSYQRFAFAPGKGVGAAADSARWTGLGASYSAAEEASSARWTALGASYSADKGAAFLAANPELMVLQRFAARGGCAALGSMC